MVTSSHIQFLKNCIWSQTIIVNIAASPFQFGKGKNAWGVFLDGIFFSMPQRMTEMILSQTCSSTLGHLRLSEVVWLLHKDLLPLPMPQSFTLQTPFVISQSLSKQECWRGQLLMCSWTAWHPGRPWMALSEQWEALPCCWHSPAGTAGREGAHTQHTSRRAPSGTRSSLGTGAYQRGHLGKQREISCDTSTALLWQPLHSPVPSPSSWWCSWVQLRMFHDPMDFKWTQLCTK